MRERVEQLRGLAARAEAFATIAERTLQEVAGDPRERERVEWIIAEAAASTQEMLQAVENLVEDLTRRP